MQISTGLFYDRMTQQMGALSAKADSLSNQISTTKRMASAADDVVGYQRLAGVKRDTADAAADDANVKLSQSLLQQGGSTLSDIASQMQRAQELAVQAGNGTLSADARTAIATELNGIVDTLASLANTKDARGQALFGGADGGAALTVNADGSYSFASTPVSAVPLGGGQSVAATETAGRIFTLAGKDGQPTNALSVIAALAAAVTAGDTDGVAKAANDLNTASDQVTSVQASLGARANRVDFIAANMTNAATDREATRSAIEDTDVTAAITELQKTMTVLQATQASFTKLNGLSLFDYLK